MAVMAGAVTLFVALTLPLLSWWYWEYTKPDTYYGYALFVPVLAGVMLWHKRGDLRKTPIRVFNPALLLLIASLTLFVVASKTDMQAVMSTTFLLSLIFSIWFVAGTAFVRAAGFPLLFLFLMAPLPGPLLNDATLGLQRLSTSGAAVMLKLIGFAPQVQGNVLNLGNFVMEVDVPCSGFKLLLCLLTFGAAFAYLSDTTRVRQFALFAAVLPLSLALNAIRITLFGVVGECLGASAAHAFHDWSGFIMLGLCMAALFGLAKGLGCKNFAGLPLF
ncbi:MAG: exosortase [Armatimonadetes bacterium]|nr:exosortase [Armatimonadota bacterium]